MIRVLIVDDHAIVRNGLAQLIRTTADLELVGTAADGREAIEQADRHRPDVIVMDLSMPGMDGATATARILAGRPDTHVLVLTSFSDHAAITAALEAGAQGYLLKHSEPEVILDAVRQIAGGESPLDAKAARVLIEGRRRAPNPLTARESEVLAMVTEGLPNKLIGRRLNITERTVKAHLTSIYQRIGVADRTQAALWAQREGRY